MWLQEVISNLCIVCVLIFPCPLPVARHEDMVVMVSNSLLTKRASLSCRLAGWGMRFGQLQEQNTTNLVSGLKQPRFVAFDFWRSEAWKQIRWAIIKVWAELVPSGGSEGRKRSLVFFTFQSCVPRIPQLTTPASLFRACSVASSKPVSCSHHLLLLMGLFLCPSRMNPCDYNRPTPTIQVISPFRDPWRDHICLVPTPIQGTHHSFQGLGRGAALAGGHIIQPTTDIKNNLGWKCTCDFWHMTQKPFKELSGNA